MTPMSTDPSLPAPPGVEYCYRHPTQQTGVHCTRCGKPICPACMIEAPVGYQCPDCVAEARREFRAGPGRRIAIANAKSVSATNALLAVIGAVFVVEVIIGGPGSLILGPTSRQLYDMGGATALFAQAEPFRILPGIATGQYWRLLTSMFLHIGLIHIAFNGYALWLFGTVIETELGRLRFLLIYFTTGIFAGAASYAFGTPVAVGAGASGAIFGLFGAFFAYNYRRRSSALAAARLQQMVRLIVLNAILALSLHFIDWRAHLGGLVAGVAAGYVAEGWGNISKRRAILVFGFSAILLAAAGLVAWRTAELTRDPTIGPFLTGLAQVGSGAAR
jgi:membrane associated rhomboid family serine protease